MSIDHQFTKIYSDMIAQAHRVKCSKTEYASGLESIMEELSAELEAAREQAEDEAGEEGEAE